MAINFKARVLLELGAELISSDAVAVYELVKNALDAGSKTVSVSIDIALQYSVYVQLKGLLESYLTSSSEDNDEFDLDAFKSKIEDCIEGGASDASRERVLAVYGNPEGLEEAIKSLENAFFVANRILIKDQGCGMATATLSGSYLTVGTPGRLIEKDAALDGLLAGRDRLHYKGDSKVPLGEKGIGRLSAMRLGHYVRVKTKLAGERFWNYLDLDWGPAFADSDLDAADLDFEPYQKKCDHDQIEEHGTSIIIRNLQSDWTDEKIGGIVYSDLSKLADPFKSILANKFIALSFQGKNVSIPILDREPLKAADAVCEARLEYDEDNEPCLVVNVNYKRHSRERTDRIVGDHLRATVREEPRSSSKKKSVALVDGEVVARALKNLGPWEMKFHWFNRGRLMREQNDLWSSSVRPFLNHWGGGFLVYRDGFRVYPYGERSDDWLDLDRKALAASAYKLNRAQMVGYLRISSIANPRLQDQTNREGFRDSYDKEALRRLLRYVILGICRPFLESVEKEVNPPIDQVVEEVEGKISTSKEKAVASLKKIQESSPEESKKIAVVMHHLEEVSEAWERAKLRIANFEEELESYMHLAGVGLMLEFVAHELSRVTQDTLRSVSSGKFSPAVVEAQLKTLEKRVRLLDELSVPGRQRRTDQDIYELAEMLVEFHGGKCDRHDIKINLAKRPKLKFSRKVERGQILQVLDNLFSNSFYWLVNRYDQSEEGVISIDFDSSKQQVFFRDNGPGIPPDRSESIFEQFVTTKPPREGRGLGLYIARRLAEENGASLELAGPDEDGLHRTFVLSFS
ncbi:ATP-binding protein [Pseudomonas aeruginosa]|uniref:ATP-binding protein n=1 Tax=Pseudomonas aeruginosa TaxID=287 RepID=UPI001C52BAED|nr:sensor histidine kinase [Pseudomonas aeruginosa]MBW0903421.1 ATP-binding protein [Pseudomonas aeruginosa]MCS7693322.1 ATP-binding protein [Pseudomonas aeruginosa]MDE9747864.1 ATP-binding protein [Pseudomonas aeruginosa]HCE7942339.1 ATP-binding protein [Pseudomonas aeruginosa]HCF0264801.1 ATP-binding protein [Pseudomonas aeruginosa]